MSIEKPRHDDLRNVQRPPSKYSRSGDYRDHPDYRRVPRTIATIIFWLFWIVLGVTIAALDVSLIRHRPDNIDTPLGWAHLLAAAATLVAMVFALSHLSTWTNRNRYK